MDSNNRIGQILITPTTARQTPRNEFGDVLARTVNAGLAIGSQVLGGMPGMPVLSAAVSALKSVAAGITSASSSAGAASDPAGGGQADLLEAQRELQAQGQAFNLQYLQLQDSMQKESREFTTVSNVMKVRHDSAKAAINNIH